VSNALLATPTFSSATSVPFPTILAGALNIVSYRRRMQSEARKFFCYACLRQATNGIEEARQYSIFADGILQDRCFVLSSYETVLLAHRIRALDAEDADVEKNSKTTARSERKSAKFDKGLI
jgi:hypothetical protein